jgi:hypothetical protein
MLAPAPVVGYLRLIIPPSGRPSSWRSPNKSEGGIEADTIGQGEFSLPVNELRQYVDQLSVIVNRANAHM